MYLRFPGATDLESWAREFRLEPKCTEDGPLLKGVGGYIYQHTDDLLGITVTERWTSAKRKLIGAGCVLVQDGDIEGTVSFEPDDTEASLAALKAIRLK